MNDILVAVDGETGNEHVMEAAVARAEREGSTLVVVHAMPTGLYESRQRRIGAVADLTHDGFAYGITQAREEARAVAERAAKEAVGGRPVEFTAVGAVGDLVPTVLATAERYDCETVVLAEDRSWIRRLFGRADRAMAKAFDGPVVRVPRRSPPAIERESPVPGA